MSFFTTDDEVQGLREDLADAQRKIARLKDKLKFLESDNERLQAQAHRPEFCNTHHRLYGGIAPDTGEDRWAFCCKCSWDQKDYVWPCRKTTFVGDDGMTHQSRKCVRCATVYTPGEHSTDTHCPDCLMKGMP